MKKFVLNIILITGVIFIANSQIFAQWTSQTSGTTQRLRQIRAVDSNVVWICGASGVVLKTTDGGNTWLSKTITDSLFTNYSMDALDSTTAWVTGTSNNGIDFKIWKTADGGLTWQQQYQNVNGFGNAIRFFDADNGVCFADPDPYPSTNWEILTTTNGGSTWNRVPQSNFPPADSVHGEFGVAGSIDVVDSIVWVAAWSGEGGTPNRVYKSTDRGYNWTVSSYNPILGESGSHYMAFSNASKGVSLTLNGSLAITTDGGENWTVSDVIPRTYRYVTNIPGLDWYVGVGNFGLATHSTNGGATWEATATGTTDGLYAVDASKNFIWAAGNNGTIIRISKSTIPVELTSLNAGVYGRNVNINWTTATELNNRGFEVQRKSTTGDFETLVFVDGKGTTQEAQSYSYTDKNVENGKYSYRLKQIDYDGTSSYSKAVEVEVKVPNKFALNQNYPNPFNPTTTISYEIAKETNVTLRVYDVIGNQVATLVNETKAAGAYEVVFDASNLSNGVYLYKIQAGNFTATKKLIFMK